MNKLQALSNSFERILRLKLYPVGIKFCLNKKELELGKIPNEKLSFCQMIHLVAQSKWTLACPSNQMGCTIAEVNFGFRKKDESDIQVYLQKLTDKQDIAENIIAIKPKLKVGEIRGLLIAPLDKIEPDIVFLIIDSAQTLVVMRAFGFATGKDLTFRTGASSNICAYGAIISYLTELPNLTIPCAGAKRNGLYQDSDLIFVCSLKDAKIIADALHEMEKKNYLNFPIIQGYLSPTKPVDYLINKATDGHG